MEDEDNEEESELVDLGYDIGELAKIMEATHEEKDVPTLIMSLKDFLRKWEKRFVFPKILEYVS